MGFILIATKRGGMNNYSSNDMSLNDKSSNDLSLNYRSSNYTKRPQVFKNIVKY